MLWKTLKDIVNHCRQSKWPYLSLPIKCDGDIFLLRFNVCAVSEPNFLHVENDTSICGNNLTIPWLESGEIGCSLFTEYVSVDKMNEPDLRVSTWVTLKSIMLCNRRQTAKRYFIGILLCKFHKHKTKLDIVCGYIHM